MVLVETTLTTPIEAGSGAIFFGAVVVLTIIAAMTFDPREIWDNMESTT